MNIYDIAEKSGVSIATISRVLNGGKNVSKKTYEKVMKVIDEEGYTPNVFARGLGLDTMQTIGILVTDVADPFLAQMISYLTDSLHQLGLNVLLSCTGTDAKDKRRELKMMMDKRVDAVFLAGSSQQELHNNKHIIEAAKEVPVIIINGYIKAPGIICVGSNEKDAIFQTVLTLNKEGYTKPLYLYNHLTYSGSQKIEGFKKAFKKLEYAINPEDYIFQITDDLHRNQELIGELLNAQPKFDSILTSEDMMAIAAQKSLLTKGLDMPVVGFNNSLLAEVASPALTSIDNMLESVCRLAVQQFNDVSQGKNTSSRIIIDCKMVERESFKTSATT